jgi:exodeoxyribonuclease VII large subunit
MEEIFTVTQLNNNIKFLLEESFDFVLVEGEISNLRRPQSGHVYFSLKDEQSQIRAVFFRAHNPTGGRNLFELEDGLKVLCRARVNVYLPRGEYQLVVESFEPLGVGALQKAFEQLKAKLSAEGLFDARHKKRLPFLPRRIGVITSPTGAVIRDILNVTRRRFPALDILIAPARVQGGEAAGEIIQALRNLHAYGGVDVIVIARGGGSLEDLMPFNDEALAREIFRSSIPIVSAVGHETDFTICDFVADLRAPTPSAAAELIVPQREELLAKIESLRQRMTSSFTGYLEDRKEFLEDLKDRLKDPRRHLVNLRIGLDDLSERLRRAFFVRQRNLSGDLRLLRARLYHQSPRRQIHERKIMLERLRKDLFRHVSGRMEKFREKLRTASSVLESLNPLGVLQRGYSITTSVRTGLIVRQSSEVRVGDDVRIRLAKGKFDAKIEKIFQE